jgi:cell division protein FtsN
LYVQVGAFGRRDNAERLRERLLDAIPHQIRIRESESTESAFYRVQVGPLRDRALAESVSQRLAALGVSSTHLIVE